MTQQSLSIVIGECIATFTNPLDGTIIRFTGESFYNEDALLGEVTMKTDRGERYMSADGSRDVLMQSMARAGERDVTFLLGEGTDSYESLLSWGQARVQPVFNFDFQFVYNTQTAQGARIHRHKRCIFMALPIPSIERGKGYITTRISFGDLAVIDPSAGGEI